MRYLLSYLIFLFLCLHMCELRSSDSNKLTRRWKTADDKDKLNLIQHLFNTYTSSGVKHDFNHLENLIRKLRNITQVSSESTRHDTGKSASKLHTSQDGVVDTNVESANKTDTWYPVQRWNSTTFYDKLQRLHELLERFRSKVVRNDLNQTSIMTPYKLKVTSAKLVVPFSSVDGKPKQRHDIQQQIGAVTRDIMEDEALWIGLGTGSALSAIVFFLCFFIISIVQKLKRRRGETKKLDLNFNSLTESQKDPFYAKLSQLHDPKTGKNYIVVIDDPRNFSIGSSSDSSSEEEIFNASRQNDKNSIELQRMNMTSTPIKRPLRLSSSAPTSPVVRNLNRSWVSPSVSPLASTTPVFASPVKLK